MERSKDDVAFDPNRYAGSPEVKFIYGCMATGLGFLVFTVVNYIIWYIGPPKQMNGDVWRWRNTYVSWIHANMVGLGALLCLMFKPEVYEDMIIYCDCYIYSLISFSLGYFFYDCLDHAWNDKLFTNYEVILHHVAVIWTLAYNVVNLVNVPYTLVALLTEVNSIFLHARKLMQFHKWPFNNWLYRLIIILNFVTFIVFRMSAVILIGFAVNKEWKRITTTYQVAITTGMGVMYFINPILLWRLFKSDVLRSFKIVNQKLVMDVSNGALHQQ